MKPIILGATLACTLLACGHTVTAGDCTIGQTLGTPRFQVDAVQCTSQYAFAFLVDPGAATCCAAGYRPESITFYLNFGPDDMTSRGVGVAVLAADPAGDGFVPGGELCATPLVWSLFVDIPGLYTLTLPPYPSSFGDLVCPCLDSGEPYFLMARINGPITPEHAADAVIDDSPIGGRTFVSQDGGAWQDVVGDLGWPGELVVHAEVACCGDPIPVQGSTWGSLKGLYR